MTVTLGSVAKLAREVDAGLPVGPGAVTRTEDGEYRVTRPGAASRHHFFVDGVLFRVAVTPEGDQTLFQIWAEIGWMPYTIEAPEKRATLQAILRASQGLESARFVVDETQKIMVLGQSRVDGALTLDTLMYETVSFLQEARPFLKVFAHYL